MNSNLLFIDAATIVKKIEEEHGIKLHPNHPHLQWLLEKQHECMNAFDNYTKTIERTHEEGLEKLLVAYKSKVSCLEQATLEQIGTLRAAFRKHLTMMWGLVFLAFTLGMLIGVLISHLLPKI